MSKEEVSIEADEILGRELLKASVHDRNAIFEEIHGVRCLALPETQDSVWKALHEFQELLQKKEGGVSDKLKTTYHKILSKRQKARAEIYRDGFLRGIEAGNHQSKVTSIRLEKKLAYCQNHYAIDDPAFRLRFLRCELFNVHKAVVRYCYYLNFVHELWGSVALEREIKLSDFNRPESKLFRKGFFQVLPFRDRSGRRIVTILGGMDPEVNPISRAKAIFYLWDAATRDSVESQKMGSILVTEGFSWKEVVDNSFQSPQQDRNLMKKIVDSVPSRIVAIHNCWPEAPAFRIGGNLFCRHVVVGSNARMRLKLHYGNQMETRYKLQSYGIPIHQLALTESGTIKLANHNSWMNTRKLLEESEPRNKNVIIVECPLTNDIVFRQGTPYWDNPGNSVFRDFIQEYWEAKQAFDEKQIQPKVSFPAPQEGIVRWTFSPIKKKKKKKKNSAGESTAGDSGETGNNSNPNSNHHHHPQKGKKESDRHFDFRDWVIHEVLNRRKGRFLEWNKSLKSFVVMTDTLKIQKKVSISIYNCRKKASAMALLQRHTKNITNGRSDTKTNNKTVLRDGPRRTLQTGVRVRSIHVSNSDNSESSSVGSTDDRHHADRFLGRGPPKAIELLRQVTEDTNLTPEDCPPPRKRRRVELSRTGTASFPQSHAAKDKGKAFLSSPSPNAEHATMSPLLFF